jgi:predicted AAA+ superfamily ATPase
MDQNIICEEMRNNFKNKGAMMEHFVAQNLAHFDENSLSPSLFYWPREKGSQKGEIDFLVQKITKLFQSKYRTRVSDI